MCPVTASCPRSSSGVPTRQSRHSTSTLYTVGHSTRSIDELIGLLTAADVELLVDVRRFPGSRRHPQFARDALAASLSAGGVEYAHAADLGGFRKPRADSINGGWEQPAFRGYADYMATPEFGAALERLERAAGERPTSIMCAEAQWWRCHRRLIADALSVRGWRVLHLGLSAQPVIHELTPFARAHDDGALTYPPAQEQLTL